MTAYYQVFACTFCPVLVAVNEDGAVLRVVFLPGIGAGWVPDDLAGPSNRSRIA